MISGLSQGFGRPQFGSGLNYLWHGKIVRKRNTETIFDLSGYHLAYLFEGEKYQKGQHPDLQTAISGQAHAAPWLWLVK